MNYSKGIEINERSGDSENCTLYDSIFLHVCRGITKGFKVTGLRNKRLQRGFFRCLDSDYDTMIVTSSHFCQDPQQAHPHS